MLRPWFSLLLISTHAPHARRGDNVLSYLDYKKEFLLTRLMRGAAIRQIPSLCDCDISTHAPHARRGPNADVIIIDPEHFYSRASCEARRGKFYEVSYTCLYFYSRASCEARLKGSLITSSITLISTHAPHARRGDHQ